MHTTKHDNDKQISLRSTIMSLLEDSKTGYCREELCRKLGLPRTTIFEALQWLYQQHQIYTTLQCNHQRGRPKVFWNFGKNQASDKTYI